MEADVYGAELRGRRARRRRFLFVSGACFAAGLAVVLVLWTVLSSPLFRVARFEIVGNSETKTDDIRTFLNTKLISASLIHTVMGFQNMLVWPEGTLPNYDPQLPRVREFVIKKSYFDRAIEVAVEERHPFGIWCAMPRGSSGAASGAQGTPESAPNAEPGACFWFDEEGVLLENAPHASGNLISVVHDYSGKYLRSQTKVEDESAIRNIVSVFGALARSGLGIREVRIESREAQEMKVLTTEGPALLFSIRFPADEAGAALASLVASGGGRKPFSQFQYVDFRVEHRAYYR